MKKIWYWIRTDGLLHIETSALIVVLVSIVISWWVGVGVSAVAGVGKELYDRSHEGHCAEWHDVICDGIGVVIGAVVVLLLPM